MKNSSRIYTNMQASKHAFSFLPQMRGYATKEKPKALGKNSYYNKNCSVSAAVTIAKEEQHWNKRATVLSYLL